MYTYHTYTLYTYNKYFEGVCKNTVHCTLNMLSLSYMGKFPGSSESLYIGRKFLHLPLVLTSSHHYRTSGLEKKSLHVLASKLSSSENRHANATGYESVFLTCACPLQRYRTKCSSWDPPGSVRPTHDHPHTTLLTRWNGANCSHPGTDGEHPNRRRIPEPLGRNWHENYPKVRFTSEE